MRHVSLFKTSVHNNEDGSQFTTCELSQVLWFRYAVFYQSKAREERGRCDEYGGLGDWHLTAANDIRFVVKTEFFKLWSGWGTYVNLGHVFYATETCLETSVNDPMCRYLWGSQVCIDGARR